MTSVDRQDFNVPPALLALPVPAFQLAGIVTSMKARIAIFSPHTPASRQLSKAAKTNRLGQLASLPASQTSAAAFRRPSAVTGTRPGARAAILTMARPGRRPLVVIQDLTASNLANPMSATAFSPATAMWQIIVVGSVVRIVSKVLVVIFRQAAA